MPVSGNSQAENPVGQAASELARNSEADVYLYNAWIGRTWDDRIILECAKRKRRKNVLLVLVTNGGNPDAAYRIARCFQRRYKKFTCLVPGYCKSAGTLLVTGAHELVMGEVGELGPLDVQMGKKDELFESESGLTVVTALDALREKCFSSFEHFALTLKRKSGNRVTFKTAAEIAVKMTEGLFRPIYQQIDPMHAGEASRSQAIAQHYGLRLLFYGKNMSPESLQRLISEYPSHGFVIDREEATALFRLVREPNELERNLIDALGQKAFDPLAEEEMVRGFISDEKEEKSGGDRARADSSRSPATKARSKRVTAAAGEGPERKNGAERHTPISR